MLYADKCSENKHSSKRGRGMLGEFDFQVTFSQKMTGTQELFVLLVLFCFVF